MLNRMMPKSHDMSRATVFKEKAGKVGLTARRENFGGLQITLANLTPDIVKWNPHLGTGTGSG